MVQRIPEPVWEAMKAQAPDVLDSMHVTFSWALIFKVFWAALIGLFVGYTAKNAMKARKAKRSK